MAKGIYCLEGIWFGVKNKTSVYPILDLLNRCEKIDHFYHRCATEEELCFMIKKWGEKGSQKKFPIIYFAAHGKENELHFGSKTIITLEKIAELLENKCERAIFYFGSCETLDYRANKIKDFLKKTNGLAAIGYRNEVEWLSSASMEILALNYLSKCDLNTIGANKIESGLKENFGKYAKELGLRVILNTRAHFPRKNKKRHVVG